MELLRGAALLLLLCAAACAQDCECPRSSAPRPLAPRGAAPAAPQNGAPSPLGRRRRSPAAALLSPVGGCGCRPVLGAARLQWVGGGREGPGGSGASGREPSRFRDRGAAARPFPLPPRPRERRAYGRASLAACTCTMNKRVTNCRLVDGVCNCNSIGSSVSVSCETRE